MQAIDSKQHQDIVIAIDKFEALIPLYGSILPDGLVPVIREKADELKKTYARYHALIRELENCIHSYDDVRDSLRKLMYPPIRKMNTRNRNKI